MLTILFQLRFVYLFFLSSTYNARHLFKKNTIGCKAEFVCFTEAAESLAAYRSAMYMCHIYNKCKVVNKRFDNSNKIYHNIVDHFLLDREHFSWERIRARNYTVPTMRQFILKNTNPRLVMRFKFVADMLEAQRHGYDKAKFKDWHKFCNVKPDTHSFPQLPSPKDWREDADALVRKKTTFSIF